MRLIATSPVAGCSYLRTIAPSIRGVRATRLLSSERDQPQLAKTYSNQDKLPRLPIPDLNRTLEAYVTSLTPLLEQKYSGTTLQKEIEKRKIFARDFGEVGGLGRALQERLKDLDHVSPNNWLDDTLWLKLAYHTWRAPLIVNSNWWLQFKDDPGDSAPPIYGSTPKHVVPDENPSKSMPPGSQGGGEEWIEAHPKATEPVIYDDVTTYGWISDWQTKKAAWLARRFAEYRLKLQREEIPPESTKAGPSCMVQYQKLFNFSRIPFPICDNFSNLAPHALHISLFVDDYYYSVDVFSPPPSPDIPPEPLPAAEIGKRISAAVADAKRRKEQGETPPLVGLLTADARDTWVTNRERLLQLSPKNRKTLESLSTSLIVLSLDPYTLPSVATDDPLRHPSIDAQVRNAATGINGGRNRWFDKAISVMVETNGRASLMGEHSPADALIPSYVVDHAVSIPVDTSAFSSSGEAPKEGEGWKRLEWVVDDALLTEIDQCQARNKALVDDSDVAIFWWGEFSNDWIKKIAKVSPDAFIQQALQLAWYKDQGYASATYETAGTRAFKHGRTDVIRTLTAESREFVKAMLDEKLDDTKRYDRLSKACATHTALTRASASGHGIDRHLMGLKVQLRPGETHALFEDEMYAKSQEWKLSTSGFSAGANFVGVGFGAAWPDGYGVNYQAGPHLLKFGIESKYSCPVTSTTRFKHHLAQSLRDIRRVCESSRGV